MLRVHIVVIIHCIRLEALEKILFHTEIMIPCNPNFSFVESAAAKKKAILESSSSSESEDDARPQFITTFGGDDRKGITGLILMELIINLLKCRWSFILCLVASDDDEDEEKPASTGVLGPQLPTKEYRRML